MSYELIVDCPDELATRQVGEKLGAQLKSGDLVELVGDVGAGKTTFVKGLAKGLGSEGKVSSPSFALKNVYEGGRLTLYHFDLYRLEESGLIDHELEEALNEKKAAVVIEWAGIGSSVLPEKRITVNFLIQDEESRKLKISLPKTNGAKQ